MILTHIHPAAQVREIVYQDIRSLSVLSGFGIDSIRDAQKALNELFPAEEQLELLLSQLKTISQAPMTEQIFYNEWDLDLLIDYSVKHYHRYWVKNIPVVQFYLDKVCRVHGERHPELFEIRSIFEQSAAAIYQRIKFEEKDLFPIVNKLFQAKEEDKAHDPVLVTPVLDSLVGLQEPQISWHREIEKLSNHYQNPKDGCTSYRIGLEKLQQFHIRLREEQSFANNILYHQAEKLADYFIRQSKYSRT